MGSLRFADALNGWASGTALFATHDGGASWHSVSIGPANSTILDLETTDGNAYAVVDSCATPPSVDESCADGSLAVYASSIDTDAWTPVSASEPFGGPSIVGPHLVVHAGHWYLPTSVGIVNGTATGVSAALPNPCAPLGSQAVLPDIAVADLRHLDAMCTSDGAGGSASNQIYGSVDGGQHWSTSGPMRFEPSGLYGIADNGSGVLLAAVASGGSAILRSTDDGATLTDAHITTAPGGLPWADLGFTTPTQAIVVLSQTAFYISHDAGATWSSVTF